MLKGKYAEFYQNILDSIPREKTFTDPLRTITYGTDASFYRLRPKIVILADNERQVRRILVEANRLGLPVTFRAAGTSLSGQAISDSILVKLGDGWRKHSLLDGAEKILLEPGIIGADANAILAGFDRKIGPDPASIDSAKIGGIVANNASGMCCGIEQNSYQTVANMRMVLADGTVVDTASDASRTAFEKTHGHVLKKLLGIRERVLADKPLAERIRRKYKIKNTTGYSLNALTDFQDPFDIMAHLMVGSEGTLGFIANVTLRTVVEHRHKASALILYPDVKHACQAIPRLKELPVAAAELIDRAGLRSVENKADVPGYLKSLADTATALLVETRAETAEALAHQTGAIRKSLKALTMLRPIEFTDVPAEYNLLWKIRKGLFPAVGAIRQAGSTVIIEDVAFPQEQLARACAREVTMPRDIFCCGFAGDLGFKVPELNASALKDLRTHVCDCEAGYSTSRTCEIGLSLHGRIPYRSILHLLDEASEAKL